LGKQKPGAGLVEREEAPAEAIEADGDDSLIEGIGLRTGGKPGGEITLRKLRVFWAVAHSQSLTRAAKMLGVTQPTMSQQLTGLETLIGAQLFERRSNQLILTETGTYLLRKSEHILRSVQEMEDGLPLLGGKARQTVRIAGVTSVMRVILPPTLQSFGPEFPDIEYDIQEGSPAEILEMLYARRINIGLLGANSITQASASFQRIPVLEDPYVLAVPAGLDLSGVNNPSRDLSVKDQALLNSTIQFVFGTQHSRRVQEFYDTVLPQNRLQVRVRSFELALDLVRGGHGVCLVPALSAVVDDGAREGVRLYRMGIEPRRIVAMIPSHYRRLEQYSALIDALQAAGKRVKLPAMKPVPPFISHAQGSGLDDDAP